MGRTSRFDHAWYLAQRYYLLHDNSQYSQRAASLAAHEVVVEHLAWDDGGEKLDDEWLVWVDVQVYTQQKNVRNKAEDIDQR